MTRPWSRNALTGLLLGLCIVATHGYFYGGQGWNQNARYDQIFAFVEPGTPDTGRLTINRFIHQPINGWNTGDWSRHGDDFYPNKAPGAQLLGIPVYAALYGVESATGIDPQGFRASHVNAWLINLVITVLPAALAGVLLFDLLLTRFGLSRRRAFWMTLAGFSGTLLWPFDAGLWGHTLSAYFIVFALCAHARNAPVVSGACWGMAVLCEYIALLPLLAWLLVPPEGRSLASPAHWRHLWRLCLGGLPVAVVLLAYQAWCFGSPWITPHSASNEILLSEELAWGAFGTFQPGVFVQLLISPYRGLWVFCPVLLLAVPGAIAMARSRWHRPWLVAGALAIASTLLLVSTFNGWHGGSATGPRYLITTLPFWIIIAAMVPLRSMGARLAAITLAAASALQMLVVTHVDTMIPADDRSPLATVYARLIEGGEPVTMPLRLFMDATSRQLEWTVFNPGEWLGLTGPATLLPLIALLLGCAWPAWRLGLLGQDRPGRA